jgi:cytochrome b561
LTELNEKKSTEHYSILAKIFHWGFVILFIYAIFKQINDINQLENTSLLKFEIIFAVLFVLFVVIRFIYMKKTQTSSLPTNTPKIQKIAAKLVHYGMYLSVTLIAVTGLMIGALFWFGYKSGFLIEIIVSLHEFSVTSTYWLIGVHVLGALYHRFLRDGVWSSMVPFWNKEKKL